MIDITRLRIPRSSYPNHNQKKFDYSNDKNIQAYLNTAARLGIDPSKIKNDKLTTGEMQQLIEDIILSKDIHEMTVHSDILWDGYNSFDEAVELIGERMIKEKPEIQEKLTLLVKYLQWDKGLNRRSIIDKHHNDIMEDSSYFKKVSERAVYFLNKVSL